MKRLIFCFDGTWNRLDAPNPTNVVLLAQSLKPVGDDGVSQIIHYDEGVGTSEKERWGGGLFGHGLLTNLVEAFKFLIFNYEIGDEIYIFGFSRGAFSARSFANLISYCGIPRRRDAARITEAVKLYENRSDATDTREAVHRFRFECSPDLCVDPNDDAWRVRSVAGYRSGQSPVLRIRYLGVWDTVGSLGVPADLLIASWANRKYRFHQLSLAPQVAAARHAVAIDERRKSFSPTLWTNLDDLNADLGYAPTDRAAPYQQRWFPGDHGSVGGGGDDRRLSDEALDWVLRGARDMGLDVDTTEASPIFGLQPDYRAPLNNMKTPPKRTLSSMVMSNLPKADRLPGPQRLEDLSESALARWRSPAGSMPDGKAWRPASLARVASLLDGPAPAASSPSPRAAAGKVGSFYTVQRGDTLQKIAKSATGKVGPWKALFEANETILTHPDRIYPGQKLWIPETLGQ